MEEDPVELVEARLCVIRISPDQLGDMYQRFWVHEGTTILEPEFEASKDVLLAYWQSSRQRERMTGQG